VGDMFIIKLLPATVDASSE